MKKVIPVIAVLLLLLALSPSIAGAESIVAPFVAVQLQEGYAQLTNVEQLCGWDNGGAPPSWTQSWNQWQAHDASLIDATVLSSTSLRFDISSGMAIAGQQDAYVSSPMALSNWFHGIRFNWETAWSNSGLTLQVWGFWEDESAYWINSYDLLATIDPGYWTNSGYTTILFPKGYNRVDVHLTLGPIVTAVPEPSSLAALACGLVTAAGMTRRRIFRS